MTAYATLVVPEEVTVEFSGSGSDDGYKITNMIGVDQAPIRATIDPLPMGDGGVIHPFLLGPRHITVEGVVLPAATNPTQAAACNELMDELIAALDAIVRADGTFTWSPTGVAARSLTVRCDVPVAFSGSSVKKFIFGLVAGNPTWEPVEE